jgi:hypothetical protein
LLETVFSAQIHMSIITVGGLLKKQKRQFMRLKSGMTLAAGKKEFLCFLTLTTKYDPSKPEKKLSRIKDQNYAFTKLKQKIERYLQKTMYVRHCKKHKLSPLKFMETKNQ